MVSIYVLNIIIDFQPNCTNKHIQNERLIDKNLYETLNFSFAK